ncbi:hypothetical protein KF840_04880 [bacterium]|nr:hypothetical protein [bacterium]
MARSEHVRPALRLDLDNADARNALGVALVEMGERDAGIRQLGEAVRVDPNHRTARGNLDEVLACPAGAHPQGR